MAKKRKGARPTKKAARSVKKKAVKKSAPKKAAAPPPRATGLEHPDKIDFNPLKEQMAKHIARLESAKHPDAKTARALSILRQARTDLTVECWPTMELSTS